MNSILKPVTDETVRSELESALGAIPSWRREQALAYRRDRDRYLCAEAYLLLKQLLASHYGIDADVEFAYGPNGKPFLKSYPDIHFNISHCPGAVFCAVSDTPIGVDVEEIQYDEDVAAKVFSDQECQMIRAAGNPAVKFTELWTRKEALLKLSGTGLVDDMRDLLVNPVPEAEFITEVHIDLNVVTSVYAARHRNR